MRISGWSSDVCSSDLQALERAVRQALRGQRAERHDAGADAVHDRRRPREHGLEDQKHQHGEDREAEYRMQEDAIERIVDARGESGRASWRERMCQYV